MRRSSRVTLVLVGLAGLAGCGEDDARRDVYRTREDCLADWGNKPQDCTPSTDEKHKGLGYFMGPVRAAGSGLGSDSSGDSSSGSSRRSIGTSSVSRGGFGSSSSSSGS